MSSLVSVSVSVTHHKPLHTRLRKPIPELLHGQSPHGPHWEPGVRVRVRVMVRVRVRVRVSVRVMVRAYG